MTLQEIVLNIKQKYDDSKSLMDKGSYSNSIYLSGYCVELALKHAVASNLKWTRYITEGKMRFMKTHDFELLVSLTGDELAIKQMPGWSIVNQWTEEKRYEDPSLASLSDATAMFNATKQVTEYLCKISL